MRIIFLCSAMLLIIQLIGLIIDMEKGRFVNGKYKHSAEHFAYLLLYAVAFFSFGMGLNVNFIFCFLLGTAILNWHIYKEGKGLI